MKCTKCGSELDTGFNCPKCKAKSYKEIVSEYNTNGEKIYEKNTIKLVQPELTTAEKLLWLVENYYLNTPTNNLNIIKTINTAYDYAIKHSKKENK